MLMLRSNVIFICIAWTEVGAVEEGGCVGKPAEGREAGRGRYDRAKGQKGAVFRFGAGLGAG